MINNRYRSLLLNAERLSITLGFGLTILSLLGAQFYLGPAQVHLTTVADDLATRRAQIQILSTAQALDNVFGQLGSMVFVLNANEAKDESQATAIGSLQRRAIEWRHEGVRNYLAQLGLAGAIDFQGLSAVYDGLVDAEQRNYSFATFQAANEFEHELAMAIVRKTGREAIEAIRLHSDWAHAQQEAQRRSLILLCVSVAGFVLLFIATLWAKRDDEAVASTARATPIDTPQDIDRVVRLLTLARDDLRRRQALPADAGKTMTNTTMTTA